jgi:hypothetical protein
MNSLGAIAKRRTQEIEDQKTAYDDLRIAQAEQAEGDLAQLQNVENLRAELNSLVDAQGNVADKDKARVSYILNEINEAYGTELTLINDNIAGYQAQMDAIDQLVEKRKYEIVQKAALPLYEKAITDEVNLRIAAERDLSAVEEAKSAREAEYARLVEQYGQQRVDSMSTVVDGTRWFVESSGIEYNKLNTAISDSEAAYANATEMVKNNLSDQTSYQQAELLAQQGNWEGAFATLDWYSSGLQQKYQELQGDETAQRQFLEKEYALADSALETYLNNVLSGTEEFNESTLRGLAASATNLYNKAKEAGANIGSGLILGMDQQKPGVTSSIGGVGDVVVNTLKSKMQSHSPSLVMKTIGGDIVKGLSAGMDAERRNAGNTATSIGDWITRAFKTVFGIHSPSKVMYDDVGGNIMLGLVNGITDRKNAVSDALNGILPDSVSPSVSFGALAERSYAETETGSGSSKVVSVQYTYNVYANDTSYAEQQRIAQKANRNLQEALYGY